MRRKKIVAIALTLLMVIGMIFSFCACTISNKEFESGYFICKYVMEDGKKVGVCILELTELGQEQEILVIPKKINNLPVRQIGRQASFTSRNRYIQSDKLRKIYLLNSVCIYEAVMRISENNDLPIDVVVMIEDIFEDAANFVMISYTIEAQYYASINSNEIEVINWRTDDRRTIKVAKTNIFFHNNYDTDNEVYWTDIINENPYNRIPQNPDRKGYCFMGWYTEKECVNKWDEKFILNSNEELHLYAKWIKI